LLSTVEAVGKSETEYLSKSSSQAVTIAPTANASADMYKLIFFIFD